MSTMQAAVVRSFDAPPRYEPVDVPVAAPGDEVEITVEAAALHPRVRSAANGSHYTSTGALPLVPGVDGVGRTPDGERVYFALDDTVAGSMAERTVIDRRRCVALPPDIDPVTVAAVMNPAMSSWIALRRRISFAPGQSVMILGATGNAGQMAVQIARHLGASHVIAAGRNPVQLARLEALGADRTVALTDDGRATGRALGAAAAQFEVDVVIDYLWGAVAAVAIPGILAARQDRGRPLTWIEIGSMAGLELSLESQWLRAARLSIVGSGQGSVPTADIVAELPALASHIAGGDFAIGARAVPLRDVEATWAVTPRSGDRIVFVP